MPEIPEGAKVPTDHERAKAETKREPIVVQMDGQTYSVSPETLDDVELMEDMADLDEQPILLPRVTRRMLGDRQWKNFKEASRNESGIVPAEKLDELFSLLNEAAGNH